MRGIKGPPGPAERDWIETFEMGQIESRGRRWKIFLRR